VRKSSILIALLAFLTTILLAFPFQTPIVSAQDTSYSIQSVEHKVEVLYSGHVVISDTISISGQLSGDFLIGFPYEYGSHVLKGMAYGNGDIFKLSLGVQLADQTGFYGAKVNFPQGAPQVFTVVFFLSNELIKPKTNGFILNFPAYPSLVADTERFNATLVLPEVAALLNITKNDGAVFEESYATQNLKAFTYSPATAFFNVPEIWIRLINISTLKRKISVNPAGWMQASDSYRITNTASDRLDSVRIVLPPDTEEAVVRDEFGRVLATEVLTTVGTNPLVNVTFMTPLPSDSSLTFTVEYNLAKAFSAHDFGFALNLDLFPEVSYYIDAATVTIILPEGARFQSPSLFSIDSSSSLAREVFQETLTVRRGGVSKKDYDVLSEYVMQISYSYNPLWLSFRPALWMWTLAAVGAVVLAIWRRPKTSTQTRFATSKATVSLSPDQVRAFTEGYSEKNRIISELRVLEERAQKGRIPRRRYKVQKRTLEVRLEAISRNLSQLKRSFRSAGGVYADLGRQLEMAEAELVEIESDIRNSEVRHMRGELPLEAYKKSLADCQRRKEKAETTINGILLRLREELR